MPPPPKQRWNGRNRDWRHLFNRDVISMPDKWEYPWYAAWDLAFHMVCFAHVDPQFAKDQLVLLLREWYMHPNGQMPAYEFSSRDVNPPVHAWACWRVYKMTGAARRARSRLPRQRVSEAADQLHLVGQPQGLARQEHLRRRVSRAWTTSASSTATRRCPTARELEQADGTAWMAFYCGTMLSMALELASRATGLRGRRLANSSSTSSRSSMRSTRSAGPGCGTRRTASTTTASLIGKASRSPLKLPLDGRPDAAAGVRGARGRADRQAARASRSGWSGSSSTARTWRGTSLTWKADGCHAGRRLLAVPSKEKLLRVLQRACSTRRSSSRRSACGRCRRCTRDKPVVVRHRRQAVRGPLHAGRIGHRAVRRQLELARAGLVPGQLPADRGAGKVPPLLRRRAEGGDAVRGEPTRGR